MKKIIILLALFATPAFGKLHLINQTGSYSGMFGIGLGLSFSNYRCEMIAGYTPAAVANEDLYSITNRHTIVMGMKSPIRAYTGTGIVFSVNDSDTYNTLPEKYPEGYYPPTGYYFTPYLGIELGDTGDNFSLYGEVTILDYYAEMYYRSDSKIDIMDVINYGFGARMRIR